MAYYLGLISPACRRDLDIIRKIRNDFAHKLEIDSFGVESIRNRCRELSYSYHEKDASARAHFSAAVMGILGQLHVATLSTIPHSEKSEKPPTDKDKSDHRRRIEQIVNDLRQSEDETGE